MLIPRLGATGQLGFQDDPIVVNESLPPTDAVEPIAKSLGSLLLASVPVLFSNLVH